MPDPTEGEELSKGAKNGPGKIGDTIVKGLKSIGETADKVKNVPKAVEREGKSLVKKGRKLVGLADGGFLTGSTSSDYITKGYRASVNNLTTSPTSTVPNVQPTTAAPPPPAASTGALNAEGGGGGSGGGSLVAGKVLRYAEGGVVGNPHPDKSAGYIRKGLDSMAKGGFITMKGPRKGAKGMMGKRMPKNGVMH